MAGARLALKIWQDAGLARLKDRECDAKGPLIFGVFIVLLGLFAQTVTVSVQPERPEYVIIITIDGCRPDKLREASTPSIDNLIAQAAYTWQAQTVFPSETPEAHASLFTGAYPGTHGYSGQGDTLRVETIFQVFKAAGRQTALIDGKGGRIAGLEVGVSYVKNDFDYRWLGAIKWQPGSEDQYGDLRVMENAIRIFVENHPILTFVLLPQVDTAGHIYGHESTEYLRAIERADQAVGMLVDNLKGRGTYESTLLVILSDHGMTGTTHGSRDPGDMTIPVIFVGPGVTEGQLSDVKIIDVAPTVAALFGLRAPAGSEGRNLFGEVGIRIELVLAVVVTAAVVVVAVGILVRRWAREVAPRPATIGT